MIKVNFNTYNTYVTDSLYQWDINRDLVINGLNLTVAPEIHFANANMDRAIVRQATLENGLVTVRIPNSLLQEALTIKAYVGIYEDDTFKVIETIEIPVIAKTRPSDYTIVDDEEIYSFIKLENMIGNIIASNNDTDGNSELVDLRYDIYGVAHPSAGVAVRHQISRLNDKIYSDKDHVYWRGKSAYEVAVDNGFEGTEAEWLATDARGPQGVSGVYVGSGDMPEGYNVQIDPSGDSGSDDISDISASLNEILEIQSTFVGGDE